MAKIKLMIVDDELISRNTIKKLLEKNESYEVVADFSDGKAALDWLRGNDIDILLCDMQMPGMNGVELIRMIHVINEFLPVIAISAFDNFDYVRGSLVNGAANYLLKHELTRKHLISALDQARDKYKIVPEEPSGTVSGIAFMTGRNSRRTISGTWRTAACWIFAAPIWLPLQSARITAFRRG